MKLTFVFLVSLVLLIGCKTKEKKEAASQDLIPYSIVKVFPHDKSAFTQGLVVEQGRLFESTGQ